MTSEERKAFFINLYNCLMIDALAECSAPKSGDEGPEQNLPVSPLKVNIILRLLKQIEFYKFPYYLLITSMKSLIKLTKHRSPLKEVEIFGNPMRMMLAVSF